MITQPTDVLESKGEGFTWDGTDGPYQNKETAMDWAEHQRIVCEARSLVQGDAPGTGVPKKVFKQLKSAYNDLSSRSIVRVSKGIHQPTVDPHLQLRVTTDFGAEVSSHKFHLNVSAVPVADPGGLGGERFQWKGVQFAFEHTDNQIYKWPAVATISKKGSNRARRLSISSVDLQAHIDEQLRLADQLKRDAAAAAAKDAFDTALAAFIKVNGGKSGKVTHTSPKGDPFPTANFKKGCVNARVTFATSGGPTNIWYDKGEGSRAAQIVIGTYSK